MLFNILFCSRLSTIKWLQNYLIPCPLKKLTGIDCPLCGFQRSLMALMQGDLHQSLQLYPATIPIMILAMLGLLKIRFAIDNRGYLNKSLLIFTGLLIAGSYALKMSGASV